MAKKQQETDPDFDLVQRAKSGDTHAFDQLVTKYDRKLYGLIYHMTSNTEDSNDLLQDTFAKAYKSLGNFRGKSSFYTWIYTIAVNMTLNHLKKKKRRAGPSYDDDESGILNDPAFIDQANLANPRRQSTIHELHDKLNEALLKLSEGHKRQFRPALRARRRGIRRILRRASSSAAGQTRAPIRGLLRQAGRRLVP